MLTEILCLCADDDLYRTDHLMALNHVSENEPTILAFPIE